MKKKLTIIDIIIVFCVIFAVVFACTKLIGSNKKSDVTMTYTVLVTDYNPEIATKVVPSDNVLLDPVQEVYGKVAAVELKPSEKYMFNSNTGHFVKQTTEERVDIYMTVEAPVTKDEYGFAVGEKYVRIGSGQSVSGSGYSVNGYVVDINE